MVGMKCFDCAAELAMHPERREGPPKEGSKATRSDGDKGSKPKKAGKASAERKGNDWQPLF